MAFSTVVSASFHGLLVETVYVEADISNGLPAFHMVGYLSSEVKEASERVRTAIKNSGYQIPPKKVVINFAPADVRKRGASFDLPIALGLLGSMGIFPLEKLNRIMVVGELSLDGKVKKVNGVLPIVMHAREIGMEACILPAENALEGALVEGIRVFGAESLRDICMCLTGEKTPVEVKNKQKDKYMNFLASDILDYEDVYGQEAVKRAVEIAVSGGHNILFLGPPGSGKTMIAKRIPTILPTLTMEESMEITKIYSVLGMLDKERPLITGRPFRSVHHTVTKTALAGGGTLPMPGEISLAHGGVLFLDELAEFQKPVLEVLRQPLEERQIRITRKNGSYIFPANFILAAALNPCPCGNYPDLTKCTCTTGQIKQYIGKISQPFLDRIDICVETPRVKYEALKGKEKGESSESLRKRIEKVREIQLERYKGTGVLTNSMLEGSELEKYCTLGEKEEKIMKQAFSALSLSARTYHKILKVSRTIADMDGSEKIREEHLMEAIGYRAVDKKYWGR